MARQNLTTRIRRTAPAIDELTVFLSHCPGKYQYAPVHEEAARARRAELLEARERLVERLAPRDEKGRLHVPEIEPLRVIRVRAGRVIAKRRPLKSGGGR